MTATRHRCGAAANDVGHAASAFGSTKIAHRRSLAILIADEGIARNSAARIIFTRFHRRKNRGSLAIFFAEGIAHLRASKKVARWIPGAVKIAAATAENRAILVHSVPQRWVRRCPKEFWRHTCVWELFWGKSKGGLTKGGLSPKFSEKIGGNSFLRNRAFSGQIGTFSGPIGAFSGPIGTNSSAPHSHGGRAEIAPKGPFLAQLAPFGPFAKPPFGFPRFFAYNWNIFTCSWSFVTYTVLQWERFFAYN